MNFNIAELKNLILWAKEQRLKKLTIGDASFEFSELAFVGEFPEAKNTTLDLPELSSELTDAENEELLFHSST